MKKTILFLSVVALLLTSCSKLESNEKKYVKGMQSDDYEESAKAYEDFCNWLQTDESTMTYDFNLMREQMGMKVVASDDKLLRCYSWVTGSTQNHKLYANLLQWKAGDSFVAYSGPIDYLLAKRKANLKNESSMAHCIDSVYQISLAGHTVYLIAQSYTGSNGMRRAYVSACTMQGVQLSLMPNIFDGVEIAGNNEFIDNANTPIGDLFKWDEKSKRFMAYQTDDQNKLIPGKYTIYQLGETRFSRLPDAE